MELAPILIFAFKRPHHTKRCIDALSKCPEFRLSELFIFVDGPRGPQDEALVEEVRDLFEKLDHPRKNVSFRTENRGLARSIITEVSRVVNNKGSAIIVEDDLIFSPCALTWLNNGLIQYKNDETVFQISAYQYNIPEFLGSKSGSFQRFATTWGWATWKRAWRNFDPETSGWQSLLENDEARREFDAGGNYPFSDMLEKQHRGVIDSWGIRWFYSVHVARGLTLMPPMSLVYNDGFDVTATHNSVGNLKRFVNGPHPAIWPYPEAPSLPSSMSLDPAAERAFRKGLRRTHALRNFRIKKVLSRLGFRRFL